MATAGKPTFALATACKKKAPNVVSGLYIVEQYGYGFTDPFELYATTMYCYTVCSLLYKYKGK